MQSDPITSPDNTPGDPSALPLTGHPDMPGDPAATVPLAAEESPANLPPDTPGDPAAEGEGTFAAPNDRAGIPAVHPVTDSDDRSGIAAPTTEAVSPTPPAAITENPASAADPAPAAIPNPTDDAPPAGTRAPGTATAEDIPESALRIAEAVIFASANPVSAATLAPLLPEGVEPRAVLQALATRTAARGVTLSPVAGGWAFRTAPDLAPAVTRVVEVPRRLPRAAMEALAIIAWHQPVTRPEIEEIRGTSLAQTTLEILLENGLIAPRGKKEAPGRPTLWGTTPRFLDQFGLNSLRDLPRREELLPEPGLPFPPPDATPEPGRAEAASAAAPGDAATRGEAGEPTGDDHASSAAPPSMDAPDATDPADVTGTDPADAAVAAPPPAQAAGDAPRAAEARPVATEPADDAAAEDPAPPGEATPARHLPDAA